MESETTPPGASALTRRDFCTGAAAVVALPLLAAGKGSRIPLGDNAGFSRALKPMIKYRGGKSKELQEYFRFIPEKFDTYYEPFVGGGATFFALSPQKAVIGDINEPLMNFYSDVKNRFEGLSQELATLERLYTRNQNEYKAHKAKNPEKRIPNANEELYYRLRDQYNGIVAPQYSRAALYFFINKTSYSGMIRYNAQGHFNVPFGRYENFNTKLITKEHSLLLQRTEILCADYEVSFKKARSGDFMFLDPPYDCIFSDYGNAEHADGFGEAEHRRLARNFRKLKCKALMVIGRTPLIEELYGEFVKAEYAKDYAVNIRNRFHSKATHYIVANYKV